VETTGRGLTKKEQATLDLRASEFSDREKESLVIGALYTQFVQPRVFPAAIRGAFEKLGVTEINIVDRGGEETPVSLSTYEEHFNGDAIGKLDEAIKAHGESR
jgi:hypothetical protein